MAVAAKLALFDFDGTITKRDSLPDFLVYAVGWPRFIWGLLRLSPILFGYVLKRVDNSWAKERMLHYFLAGVPEEWLQEKGRAYALERIESLLRDKALACLKRHLAEGDRVIVVSASSEIWLKAWCDEVGVELLATRLQAKEGVMTGLYDGRNCHGEEKVRRIRSAVELSRFDQICAYGDSSGDLPMLSLASQAFYKPFR
ncbi:HAD family hydrolase [Thiomicrorhabdus sp.]|uniref:HAD family hydrolase n=1 Tax=Thiomicrorhabdus sp. TaxID=2039724 RepID=UPI0029C90A54|nr:HAD family hydrolase [Thiomicrorhabdus sp.]